MNFFIQFINIITELLTFIIVARVLMSWFRPNRENALVRFIIDTSNPILSLAQKITPRLGMLDFSPIVAIFGLEIIRYLLISILSA